jgi:hypothetical protein
MMILSGLCWDKPCVALRNLKASPLCIRRTDVSTWPTPIGWITRAVVHLSCKIFYTLACTILVPAVTPKSLGSSYLLIGLSGRGVNNRAGYIDSLQPHCPSHHHHYHHSYTSTLSTPSKSKSLASIRRLPPLVLLLPSLPWFHGHDFTRPTIALL